MAKRKQGELAPRPSHGAVSSTPGFGDSEVVKACCQFLPILKETQIVGGIDSNKAALTPESPENQRLNGEAAAGFGEIEFLKNYYPLHPIWKGLHANGGKDSYNQVALISEVLRVQRLKRQGAGDPEVRKNFHDINLPWKAMKADLVNNCHEQLPLIFARGKRSKGRVRRKPPTRQDAVSYEVRILKESRSRCLVGINSHNQWNRRGRLRVRPNIAERLDSQKFEFYIESIWRRLSEEKKNTFTYLDSLWFSLYNKVSLKRKVLNWIEKKNIFSKKYVFVPIIQWSHWSLLILCNFNESPDLTTKRRCMLLLDSLQQANAQQLEPGIRKFIFDIFKTGQVENKEHLKGIPLLIPKVPQQRNGDECGFFVLYYIYRFLESALDHYTFSLSCTHFMKEDWFNPEEVECFIKSLDSIR